MPSARVLFSVTRWRSGRGPLWLGGPGEQRYQLVPGERPSCPPITGMAYEDPTDRLVFHQADTADVRVSGPAFGRKLVQRFLGTTPIGPFRPRPGDFDGGSPTI